MKRKDKFRFYGSSLRRQEWTYPAVSGFVLAKLRASKPGRTSVEEYCVQMLFVQCESFHE